MCISDPVFADAPGICAHDWGKWAGAREGKFPDEHACEALAASVPPAGTSQGTTAESSVSAPRGMLRCGCSLSYSRRSETDPGHGCRAGSRQPTKRGLAGLPAWVHAMLRGCV